MLFAARLDLLDEVAALDKDEFVALGVALVAVLLAATLGSLGEFVAFGTVDEDVTKSRFAAADFSGALDATFPALAADGGEICDAGCEGTLVACGICDAGVGDKVSACDIGCVAMFAGACGAGCVAAGFVVCSGAVAVFD